MTPKLKKSHKLTKISLAIQAYKAINIFSIIFVAIVDLSLQNFIQLAVFHFEHTFLAVINQRLNMFNALENS